MILLAVTRSSLKPNVGAHKARVSGTMAAAHLADRVFPIVPVRQWVLSLPFALRYRMAYDARLTSDVLNVFIRALFGELRRRAHKLLQAFHSVAPSRLCSVLGTP